MVQALLRDFCTSTFTCLPAIRFLGFLASCFLVSISPTKSSSLFGDLKRGPEIFRFSSWFPRYAPKPPRRTPAPRGTPRFGAPTTTPRGGFLGPRRGWKHPGEFESCILQSRPPFLLGPHLGFSEYRDSGSIQHLVAHKGYRSRKDTGTFERHEARTESARESVLSRDACGTKIVTPKQAWNLHSLSERNMVFHRLCRL